MDVLYVKTSFLKTVLHSSCFTMRLLYYLLISTAATTVRVAPLVAASAWMVQEVLHVPRARVQQQQPTTTTTTTTQKQYFLNHERMVVLVPPAATRRQQVSAKKATSLDDDDGLHDIHENNEESNNGNAHALSQQQSTTTSSTTTSTLSRRNYFAQSLVLATATMMTTTTTTTTTATPMITTDEFTIILRDSARSIVRVEFAGPKNDQVQVLLLDGTRFGLKDVVESSTDPRSPLKIAAMCRGAGVPTKFVNLEAALAVAPKRTKSYANARVQEAALKEKEKLARMQQDEQDRLAALAEMQATQQQK